jgi:CRP-like cAMP-binding protein
MTTTAVLARQNLLLNRLTDAQLAPLLPGLELVHNQLRETVYQRGEAIRHVYFPCSAAFSSLVFLKDGVAVEVGTIGNEGFTGIELLLDAELAVETVICQIEGSSLRMRLNDFRKAVESSTVFRKLLNAAGQAYLFQISQSVACNRLHNVNMRFARWLLITQDRVRGDEFALTQEFLAAMLGVHRPSVSLVATAFQQDGIIKYSRGNMQVLDRRRLEKAACECYSTVREQFHRVLDIPYG